MRKWKTGPDLRSSQNVLLYFNRLQGEAPILVPRQAPHLSGNTPGYSEIFQEISLTST